MQQSFSVKWKTEGTSVEIVPHKALKVIVLNDIHVPFHDPAAIDLAIQIGKFVKPDIIIFNGDIYDFFAISRFSVSPERRLRLHEELYMTRDVIKMIVDGVKSSRLNIFLAGNHEERLTSYLWSRAPELSMLEELELKNLLRLNKNWIYLDYKREPQPVGQDVEPRVVIGNLMVMHGGKLKLSGNAVNVALNVFRRVLCNAVIGHWHRADEYIQMDYEGKAHGIWVVPCLCLQRPHWDTGRIWGQGMGVITVNENGFFRCEVISFIRINGEILAFFNGKEFRSKVGEKNESCVS